jgi:hypothetical protein
MRRINRMAAVFIGESTDAFTAMRFEGVAIDEPKVPRDLMSRSGLSVVRGRSDSAEVLGSFEMVDRVAM